MPTPNTEERSRLDQALWYIRQGLNVFPVDEEKRPLLSWKPYQTMRVTEDQARQWWADHPQANIACACGPVSGILAVDIDEPAGSRELENRLPDSLMTPIVDTPSGGFQYLFRYREGLKNSVRPLPGLDIRTVGGYILLPISHCDYEKSGKRIVGSHLWRPGLEPWSVSFADMPDELFHALIGAKKKNQPRRAEPIVNLTGGTTRYGAAALQAEAEKMSHTTEGNRNSQLNASAFKMGRLVAGGEIEVGDVEAALTAAARGAGLNDLEVGKTFDSGFKAGLGHPRQAPDSDHYRSESCHTNVSTAVERIDANNEDTRQSTIQAAPDEQRAHDEVSCTISKDEIIQAACDDQKGCADLFVRLNLGKFCFDHADGLYYRFRGHYWIAEDIGQPVRAVDEVQALFIRAAAEVGGDVLIIGQKVKTAANEVEHEKLTRQVKGLEVTEKVLKGISKKLGSLMFRKQVVEFAAQGAGTLGINGTQWDQKPWDLACKNGVINLKTGYFRPGRPEDYIKSPCPTEYEPAAGCPRFSQFLDEIFAGDKELIEFTRRVFGMALIGDSFQKQHLIILSGIGRNGKDTLISIISYVLGPHLSGVIAPETLLDNGKYGRRSASGPSPDIMRLRGLRVAWASETSQGRRFDAGKAKMITGGGSLVGRPPYGRREIEFNQSHLIFLLTNHRPHAPVDDYAFWKRIKNIPFTQRFVDDPTEPNDHLRDRDLPEKLRAEAQGILRWMVDGCLVFQKEGLNDPQAVRAAGEEYRRAEDTLQDFIDETCIIDKTMSCRAGSLYQQYKSWASDNGMRPMTMTAFGTQITQRGFEKRKVGVMKYIGIGLPANEGHGCCE